VTRHPFLSDEWFTAVDQLAQEHATALASLETSVDVVVNAVVTDTPFGPERRLHLGTRDGRAEWGPDHVEDADLTVTTDYATAKEIFLAGDPTVALQAFLAGKAVLQGDLAKLMTAQSAGAPDAELAGAIRAMTV